MARSCSVDALVRHARTAAGAALICAWAGAAGAQWADNFNRPDGPLGPSWFPASGTLGNFSILGQRVEHAGAVADAAVYLLDRDINYALYAQSVEVDVNGLGPQHVALSTGRGTNNIYILVQENGNDAAAAFESAGFYNGYNSGIGWAGSAPVFAPLAAPFARGVMQTYFTNAGDTLNLAIDTNADGVPDQTYQRNGVNTISGTFLTSFGVGAFGPARFDTWELIPSVVPPSPHEFANIIPFGRAETVTVHQVFRSGLWNGPVRITGLRYAPTGTGTLEANVRIDLGYTTRTPGVSGAAGGLSIPSGVAGSPNALGAMLNVVNSPTFSQTFAGANPDNFQLAFGATPGFVYFPGVGNLLLQTRASTTTALPGVSRVTGSADASRSFTGTLSGALEDPGRALRVQFIAMPVRPDVLPTWPRNSGSIAPFAALNTVMHQVHHAGTLAPLGEGGKVAIQAIRFASSSPSRTITGPVRISMGYTPRVAGVSSLAGGLSVPNAVADGSPNAAGPLSSFFNSTVNRFVPGGAPDDYAVEFRRSPFVFDPVRGNLLLQIDTQVGTSGFDASASARSAEASRAYRSDGAGNLEDVSRATKVKFVTTRVSEPVLPSGTLAGFAEPFAFGDHAIHQVFSSSVFGDAPVRIESIALNPLNVGAYTANDLTVRLGYTSREPNQTAPVGLDVPLLAGGGQPNASITPMILVRSGPFSANVATSSSSNFQFVFEPEEPFLYNPALGNLLVEIVSSGSSSGNRLVGFRIDASPGTSVATDSSVFGVNVYTNSALSTKISYFEDLFPCPADLTGNNGVDLEDFFAFLNCFDATDRCADLNGSGDVDLADFFDYLNAFDTGC